MHSTIGDLKSVKTILDEAVTFFPDLDGPHFMMADLYFHLAYFDLIRRGQISITATPTADIKLADLRESYLRDDIQELVGSGRPKVFRETLARSGFDRKSFVSVSVYLLSLERGKIQPDVEKFLPEMLEKAGKPTYLPVVKWPGSTPDSELLRLARSEMQAARNAEAMPEPNQGVRVIDRAKFERLGRRLDELSAIPQATNQAGQHPIIAEHHVGAQPPIAPVLRIEAGMHSARINSLSVDRAGRLVLTASADKTARLWGLPDGKLLRVLRPPAGESDEGKLYACAVSPDGALAAVAGWTGYEWEKNVSVYMFDTVTGGLVRRLSGMPDVITSLAFSAKGRFVAAVLAAHGLRVWEVASWREVGRDADYGKDYSYCVDWYGEDRLVTACHDGCLRVYRLASTLPLTSPHDTGSWKVALQIKAPIRGGQRPATARFSPDGRRVGVGFADSTRVTVVDSSDLSFLFEADTEGIYNGDLSSVTWSEDGTSLAAGGRWQGSGANFSIRRWGHAGKSHGQDSVVASDMIADLRALPQGGILFGAGDSAWGVLSARGQRSLRGTPPLADYRDDEQTSHFRISADGGEVTFGFTPLGKIPARFSIAERKLSLLKDGANLPTSLRAPRLEGLAVTDWKDAAPKLAGQRLSLERFEHSRSLSIAPDASGFLLGTTYRLLSFSATGAVRWKVAMPDNIWAVNLTTDDQFAVAACGDGTIRWYRADTGRELLAFFPHADRQRWVLWTPQGYYDCSPGAENLIGWHVNRGKDQAADFFSASQFRNVYYRPDVIEKVLKVGDVAKALRETDQERGLAVTKPESTREVIARLSPPVVELEAGGVFGMLTVPAESTEAIIRYRVRQTGAEAPNQVTVRFNGRLVDVAAPVPKPGEPAEVSIPVGAGMVGEITVQAEHQLAMSEPAVLRIERATGSSRARRPNLHLLTAGVSQFKVSEAANSSGSRALKDGDLVLEKIPKADDDAKRIARTLRVQKGKLFGEIHAQTLTNEQATAPALRRALEKIAREAGPEDVAIVFFSSHGVVDPKLGFYLATYEADPKAPAETALTGKELSKLLEGIKARTVLALDTCHAGGAFGGARLQKVVTSPNDLTGLINELSSADQGTVVLSSSAAAEQSLSAVETGGLFTQALCEGLTNKAAADATGAVTCRGLQTWLNKRVPELVAALVNGVENPPQQTPVCVIPKGVPDCPLAKP